MSARSYRRTNRTYPSEQKLAAIQDHLVNKLPVTEVCTKYQTQPSVYYGWQKVLFERGAVDPKPNAANENKRIKALENKLQALEDKLKQKNEVISELLEEHVTLKKKLNGGT